MERRCASATECATPTTPASSAIGLLPCATLQRRAAGCPASRASSASNRAAGLCRCSRVAGGSVAALHCAPSGRVKAPCAVPWAMRGGRCRVSLFLVMRCMCGMVRGGRCEACGRDVTGRCVRRVEKSRAARCRFPLLHGA